MKWLNIEWANKLISISSLKVLHQQKKVFFVDKTRFQGPYGVIHAKYADNLGKEHRFDIEVDGKIFKDQEGKEIFKVKRARLGKIPQPLRGFLKQHYAQIIKDNLDILTNSLVL